MIECPAYQRQGSAHSVVPEKEEARAWAEQYLQEDVTRLQFLKQHHHHPLNAETGERIPLHGCERADKPGVCKSEFPRTAWLMESGLVLCPCKALSHGMAVHG